MASARIKTIGASAQRTVSGAAHIKLAPHTAATRKNPSSRASLRITKRPRRFVRGAQSFQGHAFGATLGGFQLGAVEVNGDAAPKEFDRDDQKSFPRIAADQDAFDVRERAARDAHTLPFPKI